jgi:hypothetical protein
MLASVVGGARQEHTSLLITANAAGISARMVATFMLEFGLVLEMMLCTRKLWTMYRKQWRMLLA